MDSLPGSPWSLTCSSIRGGNFHGVWGDMGSVGAPILAWAREGDSLLVAGELDELAELLLREHLQRAPEELDVLVGLHQAHLVHGVCLRGKSRMFPSSPFGNLPHLHFKGLEGEGRHLWPQKLQLCSP